MRQTKTIAALTAVAGALVALLLAAPLATAASGDFTVELLNQSWQHQAHTPDPVSGTSRDPGKSVCDAPAHPVSDINLGAWPWERSGAGLNEVYSAPVFVIRVIVAQGGPSGFGFSFSGQPGSSTARGFSVNASGTSTTETSVHDGDPLRSNTCAWASFSFLGQATGDQTATLNITNLDNGSVVASIPVRMKLLDANPQAAGKPKVVGKAVVGGTLRADAANAFKVYAGPQSTPFSYSYQWQRCDNTGANCTAIDGATADTYSPVVADLGSTVSVTVTASNPSGDATATSAPTAVIAQQQAKPTTIKKTSTKAPAKKKRRK